MIHFLFRNQRHQVTKVQKLERRKKKRSENEKKKVMNMLLLSITYENLLSVLNRYFCLWITMLAKRNMLKRKTRH